MHRQARFPLTLLAVWVLLGGIAGAADDAAPKQRGNGIVRQPETWTGRSVFNSARPAAQPRSTDAEPAGAGQAGPMPAGSGSALDPRPNPGPAPNSLGPVGEGPAYIGVGKPFRDLGPSLDLKPRLKADDPASDGSGGNRGTAATSRGEDRVRVVGDGGIVTVRPGNIFRLGGTTYTVIGLRGSTLLIRAAGSPESIELEPTGTDGQARYILPRPERESMRDRIGQEEADTEAERPRLRAPAAGPGQP